MVFSAPLKSERDPSARLRLHLPATAAFSNVTVISLSLILSRGEDSSKTGQMLISEVAGENDRFTGVPFSICSALIIAGRGV